MFGQKGERQEGPVSWIDMLSELRSSTWEQIGLNQFMDDFKEVYGMLTQSDEYVRQTRLEHITRGALRSGEGTPDQIRARQRLFEEEKELDRLEETGEITTDFKLREKQFQRWAKKRQ